MARRIPLPGVPIVTAGLPDVELLPRDAFRQLPSKVIRGAIPPEHPSGGEAMPYGVDRLDWMHAHEYLDQILTFLNVIAERRKDSGPFTTSVRRNVESALRGLRATLPEAAQNCDW
jgi:hypothetical protein